MDPMANGHVTFSGGEPDRAHFGFDIEAGDKNTTISFKNERGGLAVQSVKGVGGQHTYVADGSSGALAFVTKEGQQTTLHHATVHGQGPIDAQGHLEQGTALVTTSENGYAESHRVNLSYDPQTDRWRAEAVDSSFDARNDHQTSGETLKLKTDDGQGSFTLAQGRYNWHGDENNPNTWFEYSGTIIDPQGRSYQGTAMYRDGELSYSDMRGGMRSEHIGEGGKRELTHGDPTSPQGAIVTTSSQGLYAFPTGKTNSDGVPIVGVHRMTKTSTSHHGPDRDDPSQMKVSPIETIYSATDDRGSFAIRGRERPIDEFDKFAVSGETEMWVAGEQETHSAANGPSLKGIPLIESISGHVDAETTRNFIRDDGKGNLSSVKETRAPVTNQLVSSEATNRNRFDGTWDVPDAFVQGKSNKVAGSINRSPDGQVVSYEASNVGTGKMVRYQNIGGKETFGVANIQQDPHRPGEKTYDWNAVSREEFVSVGGFHHQDFLDSAGTRVDIQGTKGSDLKDRDNSVIERNVQAEATHLGAIVEGYHAAMGGKPDYEKDAAFWTPIMWTLEAANKGLDDANKMGALAARFGAIGTLYKKWQKAKGAKMRRGSAGIRGLSDEEKDFQKAWETTRDEWLKSRE
jgi:hypothetical protein